jgi:Peptidase M50B-like
MLLDDIIYTWSRPDVLLLAGVSLFLTLLWRAPVVGLLFYPFRLLNTFVHELCHGVAAMLTGGSFERFAVFSNREGLAHVRGGSRLIVASAGYLGSALFGGALILLSATELAVQTILISMGAGLAVVCLLFVRNPFGFLMGLLLAAGLGAAGWYLPDQPATVLFALLAIQLPLESANSLIDLVRLSVIPPRSDQLSDAQYLAKHTHIPALIWALLWFATALAIMVVTVTLAFRDRYLF